MIPWLMAVSTPIRMKIMKPNGHICVSLKFGHILNLLIAIFVAILRVQILSIFKAFELRNLRVSKIKFLRNDDR